MRRCPSRLRNWWPHRVRPCSVALTLFLSLARLLSRALCYCLRGRPSPRVPLLTCEPFCACARAPVRACNPARTGPRRACVRVGGWVGVVARRYVLDKVCEQYAEYIDNVSQAAPPEGKGAGDGVSGVSSGQAAGRAAGGVALAGVGALANMMMLYRLRAEYIEPTSYQFDPVRLVLVSSTCALACTPMHLAPVPPVPCPSPPRPLAPSHVAVCAARARPPIPRPRPCILRHTVHDAALEGPADNVSRNAHPPLALRHPPDPVGAATVRPMRVALQGRLTRLLADARVPLSNDSADFLALLGLAPPSQRPECPN